MCKDNSQAVKIAKEFTKDLVGLHTTLQENYKLLTDRRMKMKFTKISKQLESELSAQVDQQ